MNKIIWSLLISMTTFCSTAQSKKEQIEVLNYSNDSLNKVVQKERDESFKQKLVIEQQQKEIEALTNEQISLIKDFEDLKIKYQGKYKDKVSGIEINNKTDNVSNDVEEENWSPPVVGEVKVTEEKAPETYTFVDEDAEFPGGYPAMMAYIERHLVYPEVAKKTNIQGKCYLKFLVASGGSISSVQVIRGIPGCPECDEEARKVVKSMPNWKAGKAEGKSVSSWFQLPINFK